MRKLLAIMAALALSVGAAQAQLLNALMNVFYIPPGGDCSVVACTSASKRMCRNSITATTAYVCNQTTGFYVPIASVPSGPPGSDTQMIFNDAGNFAGSPQVTVNKVTGVVTLNATAGTTTMARGATSPLKVGVDYTMANPAQAPTMVINSGGGSCSTNGSVPWIAYTAWVNESGVTMASPASNSAVGSLGKHMTVTRSESVPANAKGWVIYYSPDSGTTKKLCQANASAVTLASALISSGTTSADCWCNATGPAHPGSNQTGQKDHVSVNGLGQGFVGVATFDGSATNAITPDARRLDLSGLVPRFSGDSGVTFGNLFLASTKMVSVCPSGCQYATLNAACAANTSTAANPILFFIGPGLYAGTASCSGQDHAAFVGSGQGVSIVGATSGDIGINTGTSTNLLISNMTLQGFRGLQWGGGLGVSYVRNVELSSLNSGGTNEDCSFVGADTATGSELHYEFNRCHQADDGFTTFGDAHLSVFLVGNTFDFAATPDPNTNRFGSVIGYSAPCKIQSFGNTFNLSYTMTAASSGSPDYGIDAYVMIPGGTNCATSTIDIRGDEVNLTNGAANAVGSQAQGVYIGSAAAMITDLTVSGSKFTIGVPNDTSAGNSRGVVVDNATTVATISGTKLRATGGQSATRFDLKGNTAANLIVDGSVDWQADNGLLTLRGARPFMINVPASGTASDLIIGRTDSSITVRHIHCIVDAATSIVLTLRACDGSSGGSCTAVESAITCGTTDTTESGAIDVPAVAAGKYLRVLRGTVSGSPDHASISVDYTTP